MSPVTLGLGCKLGHTELVRREMNEVVAVAHVQQVRVRANDHAEWLSGLRRDLVTFAFAWSSHVSKHAPDFLGTYDCRSACRNVGA